MFFDYYLLLWVEGYYSSQRIDLFLVIFFFVNSLFFLFCEGEEFQKLEEELEMYYKGLVKVDVSGFLNGYFFMFENSFMFVFFIFVRFLREEFD